MTKITGQTKLKKLFKDPRALRILAQYGLPCLACPMVKLEMDQLTIGQVCGAYSLDLVRLLEELNSSRKD